MDDVVIEIDERDLEECGPDDPKWTPEQAKAMLAKLSAHYGEPVKPISHYCKAFYTWQRAIETAYRQETEPYTKLSFENMVRDIRSVALYVSKSNLLARLLYIGEELRTEPCPIHKGHWSGCAWEESACPYCMSGSNITGWKKPV